jgi:sortase A
MRKKSAKKSKNNPLPIARLLLYSGIGLSLIGFYLIYHRTILSFTSVPPQFQAVKTKAAPQTLTIPALGIAIGIKPGFIMNGQWSISPQYALHLTTSSNPREGGNIVIYGHNKDTIFGRLPNAQIGGEVILTTADGQSYQYRIMQKAIVFPNQTELIFPTNHEVITIYTCTGFLDSQRLIIRAEPV